MGGSWGVSRGGIPTTPTCTHANSTNICPIKTVVRCQISYSIGFNSARCLILIWRSGYYTATVFVIVVR